MSLKPVNHALFAAFLLFALPVSGAQDTNSSTQALDQLRLLQKKLAKNDTPNMVQDTENAAPLSPAPTVATNPRPVEKTPTETTAPAQVVPPSANSITTSDDEAKTIDALAFRGVEAQMFPLDSEKIQAIRKKYTPNVYFRLAAHHPKHAITHRWLTAVNLLP